MGLLKAGWALLTLTFVMKKALGCGAPPGGAPPVPLAAQYTRHGTDTATAFGRVTVVVPLALLADRLTAYRPVAAYWCMGFCRVLVVPSPKFQSHEAGKLVLRSVN